MAKSAAMVAAGKHLSFSRPAHRAATRNRARIPVCVEPPTPFAEGPGPGRDWWEKALSEKSFSARKHENSPQNQGVGAKSRTTNLGPFGEVIRLTGPMAKVNPFRFSTKYDDDESDLFYYGYRYYKPSTGTWPNRDPLKENGFNSLYGNLIHKKKSNSEIANEYLAKLYSIRPYVRQRIEPLANRINWDMVSIPDDQPKQREAANLYVFVNNNPVSNCDYLGLNLYGPGPVDVFPCLLWWHHFPAGLVLAFVPAAKNCPMKEDQSCCNGANTVFDDSYLPGGGLFPGDSQSYALALSLAQVYFQSCMTLGD